MGVTRAATISVIHKKDDKKGIANYRPMYYNSEESTAKNINTIIGENQSAAIKKIEQFYILFLLFETLSVCQIN